MYGSIYANVVALTGFPAEEISFVKTERICFSVWVFGQQLWEVAQTKFDLEPSSQASATAQSQIVHIHMTKDN